MAKGRGADKNQGSRLLGPRRGCQSLDDVRAEILAGTHAYCGYHPKRTTKADSPRDIWTAAAISNGAAAAVAMITTLANRTDTTTSGATAAKGIIWHPHDHHKHRPIRRALSWISLKVATTSNHPRDYQEPQPHQPRPSEQKEMPCGYHCPKLPSRAAISTDCTGRSERVAFQVHLETLPKVGLRCQVY